MILNIICRLSALSFLTVFLISCEDCDKEIDLVVTNSALVPWQPLDDQALFELDRTFIETSNVTKINYVMNTGLFRSPKLIKMFSEFEVRETNYVWNPQFINNGNDYSEIKFAVFLNGNIKDHNIDWDIWTRDDLISWSIAEFAKTYFDHADENCYVEISNDWFEYLLFTSEVTNSDFDYIAFKFRDNQGHNFESYFEKYHDVWLLDEIINDC